ncbi:MAG: flagellar biosynthesis protein FlhA, partial [Clostridiales bacterium]|nr:flagellar biosynthesis protein FlhA [Clostridiales bacterium]
PMSDAEYYRNIDNIYSLINIDPIEMEFGYSLIPLVDENQGAGFIDRVIILRKKFATEMGVVVPTVSLKDNVTLIPSHYVVKIKGEEVAQGEVLVNHFLVMDSGSATKEIEGIETVEPAFGIPAKWVKEDARELAETSGYAVIDPLSVMLTHLTETVKRNLHELLTRAEVIQLVDNLKKTSPELVEEAIPNIISFGNLQKILYSLLKEGIPIRDMGTIIETIVDSSVNTKDMDVITENVRMALKRTITRKFNENGQIKVITLDAEVEKSILTGLTRNEHGVYLALNPDVIQKIIEQLKDQLSKFTSFSQQPVILTSHVIRVYFYRLIEQFYPNVAVLSFSEISNDVQIQAIGNIQV